MLTRYRFSIAQSNDLDSSINKEKVGQITLAQCVCNNHAHVDERICDCTSQNHTRHVLHLGHALMHLPARLRTPARPVELGKHNAYPNVGNSDG